MIDIAFALLLAAQEPQVNCRDPQVQQEMNYCAAQDAERADAELNIVYRTAIASAQAADREFASYQTGPAGSSSEPGEEASLREAQRAWVAFREAHCRLEGYEARGGSMEPMLEAGCRATITRARTAELRGPECPGDAEQAAINACLNRVFTRADAALNRQWEETLRARAAVVEQLRTAQRAWLAYRDAQCASATPSVASADIQASEQTLCRTRLTEARTHELADLAAMAE
jgi:uncharacterized protein YecT (DUF1311 family)